jgi:nanoRNase/pAp phosphatase (c-di-AMP/oligoRNAs hydrolase)
MPMTSILESLHRAVEGRGDVLILPHTDPDPDAIAGAVALRHILTTKLGLKATIAYSGIIGRAENKTLFEYLLRPMVKLTSAHLKEKDAVALVDTQPGTGNTPLPAEAAAAIVIDHHPLREETAGAAFADVRPDVGATSTILTGYLVAMGFEPPPEIATALFYGIKTDTLGLGRGAGPGDVDAYFYLQSRVDVEALSRIEHPGVPVEYFRGLAAALQAAKLYDDVVIAYIGPMGYPDMGAEMADLLMRLHGVNWVLCMGVFGGELVLSVRARSDRANAGKLVQALVGSRGSAGGHGMMAGGSIPLQGEPRELVDEIAAAALAILKGPSSITPTELV